MVWDAVIFMPEYGESGKFRGFGLEALVGKFSYGAELDVVGDPEEGHGGFVVGLGLQRLICRLLPRLPVFVGEDESGAPVLDAHHLLLGRAIDPDVFTLVEEQQLGAQLRIDLWPLNQ